MAPLDIPFHWKQIHEKLENIHQEGDEETEVTSSDSEIDSDSEVWSDISDSDDWSEEVIVILPQDDDDDSEVDTDAESIEYIIFTEEESYTPVLSNPPDARRRLFENDTSGDEDDGVAYLSD